MTRHRHTGRQPAPSSRHAGPRPGGPALSSPCSSSAACTNHVPVITTLLRGGMWHLPLRPPPSPPHPPCAHLGCSHRGPCRCPGPSGPHAPAPGQVQTEHPAGGPLPVPGGRAAGGEAGERPPLLSHGTQRALESAPSPQTPASSTRAPGSLHSGTPSPARPPVPDHPDAEGVPGAPGPARAAGAAGRPVHPPPDDEHQRAGEPWPPVRAPGRQGPQGQAIRSEQPDLVAGRAVAGGCNLSLCPLPQKLLVAFSLGLRHLLSRTDPWTAVHGPREATTWLGSRDTPVLQGVVLGGRPGGLWTPRLVLGSHDRTPFGPAGG